MKSSLILCSLALSFLANAIPTSLGKRAVPPGVPGFDISHYQTENYDFKSAYNNGARFVIIKATEGTTITDAYFSSHYTGATSAGLIRGGYHFAHPNSGSGSTQANFFLAHGGGWSGDGITLPGMLDIEYNPSGATCYGLTPSAMVTWISDFVSTYHTKTGRYPLIYSTNGWWSECTGNSAKFSSTCPLVLARYPASIGDGVGTVPGGWGYETIWQYADSYGGDGGDADVFNGDLAGLKKLASG